MSADSIVVMESGADWPAWVDEEAGAVSNVVVLARQRGESPQQFEARVKLRLQSIAELESPRRGVLVCAASGGKAAGPGRATLVRALLEVVRRAGGGEVVLVGDVTAQSDELSAYATKLNERRLADAGPVSLRFRPPPGSAEARNVA